MLGSVLGVWWLAHALRRPTVRGAVLAVALLVGAAGAGVAVHDTWRVPAPLFGVVGEGTTITVGFSDPYCDDPPPPLDTRVDVVETVDTVSVIVWVRRRWVLACNDLFRTFPVEVHLDSPLGHRTVIDGSTGRPVEV